MAPNQQCTDPHVKLETESVGDTDLNSVTLARRRALWDDETQKYLSHWESHANKTHTAPPNADFFNNSTKKLEGIFALRWEQKQIPRTSAWTSDALRSDNHILGKLELVIPWVLLTGPQCVEVGDLLSKQTFKIRS